MADVAAIARVEAIPSILDVCCRVTGMGFAAVARVTEDRWIACAVRDEIDFGLGVGGELPVRTTLCDEVRDTREVIVFDHAAEDPRYATHHTPLTYGLQSYISMPIIRADGSFFGTLCAIDPRPHRVSKPETIQTFELFAALIAAQLDADERLARSQADLVDERTAAELRDQFIAVLGHDLRNPLAAIQAGTEMLKREDLDPRAAKVVDQMRVSALRMGRLINDVLDFARGRLGGGLPLNAQTGVQLGHTLEQVVGELRSAQGGRAIRTDFALARPVACDPDRIGQLLSNLLANALTHGSPDGEVRVRAVSDADGFELSVTNQGAPISPSARADLFKPFKRLGPGQVREGLGLGLYIASQIAAAHGGVLEVASDSAETRFTFRMPA
ncbi:GAF domain-containing sensor histidine kinase [Brevundimonas sp. Root1279]|uniref:GAF domain-containing sensor histidine kinase n=1 Tax=Brevundimonas sp. Root1279 TaxID=1736443 RepID=UPI0019104A52|nr:GAF domain-containing sensor histidine kinase [Brevundimonas sp. Root1279]